MYIGAPKFHIIILIYLVIECELIRCTLTKLRLLHSAPEWTAKILITPIYAQVVNTEIFIRKNHTPVK